ncbi:MAG: ATPase, T2SS/T4P/T4SS family [Acidiphilium sp.]|nr:ATPase, T2SS/T4P/T4SS family [Acidiphilium sp.]
MGILRETIFDDLYLESDLGNSRIRGLSGSPALLPVPGDLMDDIRRLFESVRVQFRNIPDAAEFSVPYDDVMYRVSVIRDIRATVFALRRGAVRVPPLIDCNIPPIIIDRLKGLSHGLVLFSGSFSTGKTTASSAYALEFSMDGGLVVTLEDPPELALSGDHGRGRILQIQIDREHIERAIEATMRMSFDMLFVSEIRTPAMASEIINASINGKLIVSTIHADSIVGALMRLATLAGAGSGGGDRNSGSNVMRGSMSGGLAVIIHMTKRDDGTRGSDEILLCTQNVRSKINAGEFSRVQEDINQLKARMLNGLPISG